MSRNYKFHNPDGVYFVSFAVVEWIEVFKATRGDSCGSGEWTTPRIKEEVEYAIKNNKGLIDPTDATKGYYGFSKDGKIKIGFYYRESDGYIGSFFPILTP